jgi:hypothetical protein
MNRAVIGASAESPCVRLAAFSFRQPFTVRPRPRKPPTVPTQKAGVKAAKRAAKPSRNTTGPRAESKDAKILEMIARATGGHARRDHESLRLADAQRPRIHFDRR